MAAARHGCPPLKNNLIVASNGDGRRDLPKIFAAAAPMAHHRNTASAATPTDMQQAVTSGPKERQREKISSKDFPSLQDAVSAAGGKRLEVEGAYLVARQIYVPADVEIVGTQGASITLSAPDLSVFQCEKVQGVRIRGLAIKQTTAGTKAYVAGVALLECSDCVVESCEFSGMQWAGIYLKHSSRCILDGNRFSNFSGKVRDSADICIHGNSSDNEIKNNACMGAGDHGILVQDPYIKSLPLRNAVLNNRVGKHDAYGIAIYQPNQADTFSRVTGNRVEDIVGSALGNSSGAGIYVVGAGGVVVSDNIVRNCCRETGNRKLTPGGIGINGINTPLKPVEIYNNTISDTNEYDCITVSSSSAGAIIKSNQLSTSESNKAGAPIYVTNASNVTIFGNEINQPASSARGILVQAKGVDCNNLSIGSNRIRGGNFSQIETLRTEAAAVTRLKISGNTLTGMGDSGIPLRLGPASVKQAAIASNHIASGNKPAIYQGGCTEVQYADNYCHTMGPISVQFVGDNAGSRFDATNIQLDSAGSQMGVANQGTGLKMEVHGDGPPRSGTWAAGDVVEQTAPPGASAERGRRRRWRCVTPGSPGQWEAEDR